MIYHTPKPSKQTEFHYRGIQITIRHTFGYQYYFLAFGKEYLCSNLFYVREDLCKDAAKQVIDEIMLIEGKRDVGDSLDV